MRRDAVVNMLALQGELNGLVHPEWMRQGFNWRRAAFVESAELMDHWGWKWWKRQEPDVTQAHIELVDIWHFLLSHTLEITGDVHAAADWIVHQWGKPGAYTPDMRGQIERFVVATLTNPRPQISEFRTLCLNANLDSERLYELYLGKNVLNIFRQRNGYRDGTYTKVWDGREDNEVLAELMTREKEPAALFRQLDAAYADIGPR